VDRIEALAGADQQLFLSTHNSFVLNRLGLNSLLLLHKGAVAKLSDLPRDTVAYFRRLAGYDTLRIVLADRIALVEGPSDVIVLERAFMDATGKLASAAGIDVVSMNGLTFRRALEVCAGLGRRAVALRDNDDRSPEAIEEGLKDLLASGQRELLVSDPAGGATLEPQLIAANSAETLRRVLNLTSNTDVATWMRNNKTEAALRIFDSAEPLVYPDYITRAVDLLK
jgi:putative ATP-dependent endonuclease of the OLD family